jgi:Flp pilus assembly protein TadG
LHEERGQSATEFAVVLPLLMIFLLGIVQGAVMLNHWLTLNDAVRVGARIASIDASQGQATATSAAQQAMQDAASGVTLSGVQITSPTWQSGDSVTVTASTPYTINLLGVVVMSGNLTSSTTQRNE